MAANFVQPVSLTTPTDYTAQGLAIERQRQLAQSLLQQGSEPLQTNQTAGGYVIPVSPLQGLAKALQSGLGGLGVHRADVKERALAQQYQSDLGDTLTKAQAAMTGTPAQPDAPDENGFSVPGAPAQAPNAQLAASLLMRHPATQALGMSQIQAELTRQQTMQRLKDVMAQFGVGSPAATPQQSMGAQAASGAPSGPTNAAAAGVSQPNGGMLVNPLAAALTGTADPALEKLGAMQQAVYAETLKPVVNRGFGVGTMVNGQYMPDAASGRQAADTSGLVAAAKGANEAPFKIVDVPQQGGGSMPTPSSLIPGIGQPIGSSAPAAPSPSGFGPGQTPAPPAPPGTAPAPVPPAQQGVANAALDASAAGKPFTQTIDPWASMPKMNMPQGVGPQTTFNRTISEGAGKAASDLSKKYGDVANTANQRIATNNQALDMVDKADTGPLAGQIGDVKNWLVSRFNVPEGDFQNTPSATQALQKDLVNAATSRAKQQFGSRITQNEVNLMLTRGAPNVDMTKAAIKYLVNTDNAQAQYSIQQSNDLGKYLSQGGDPMRFEGWYAQNFPQTNAVSQVKLNTSGSPSLQDLMDEAKRRGLVK